MTSFKIALAKRNRGFHKSLSRLNDVQKQSHISVFSKIHAEGRTLLYEQIDLIKAYTLVNVTSLIVTNKLDFTNLILDHAYVCPLLARTRLPNFYL
jgi:hypothetical protein